MSDNTTDENQGGSSSNADEKLSTDESTPVKRGRGRPRKTADTLGPIASISSASTTETSTPLQQEEQTANVITKKSRGRPRTTPFSVTTNSPVNIPVHVAQKIGVFPVIPTMDEWFGERLTADEMSMYQQLMQAKFTSTERFPVSFDTLWMTLQYSHKHKAVDALLRLLVEDVDYCSLLPEDWEQSGRGGQNAKNYALTLDAAQRFALASRTAKGEEVRNFFVKTLDVVQDYHLLSLLAAEKRKSIEERHSFYVKEYAEMSGCYIGIVGYKDGVLVAKIGSTDDLSDRVKSLRQEYGSFWCCDFIPHPNGRELERAIKANMLLASQRFDFTQGGVKHGELYRVTEFCDLERYGEIIRELAAGLKTRGQEEWAHKEKMLAGETELVRQHTDYLKQQSEHAESAISLLRSIQGAGFSVSAMEDILLAYVTKPPPPQLVLQEKGNDNGLCEAGDSDDESYLDTNTEEEEADRPKEIVKDYIAENLCPERGMMVGWNAVREDMDAWAFSKDKSRNNGVVSRKLGACHTKELWNAFTLEGLKFKDHKPGTSTTQFARFKAAEGWRFIDARKPSVQKYIGSSQPRHDAVSGKDPAEAEEGKGDNGEEYEDEGTEITEVV